MLTAKQERFVQELLKGKSQREAYKAAYNTSRMKDRTVDSKACLLFKKDYIRARYAELTEEVAQQVVIDAAYVKRKIIDFEMAVLEADPYKFVNDSDEKSKLAIKNYKVDAQGRVTFEFYDKHAAVDNLREIFGIQAEEKKENDIHIHLHSAEGYDV